MVTRATLERELALDFPEHVQQLLSLCMVGSRPLGGNHVEYLDELVAPRLPPNLLDSLSHAYVFLAAAFFCIDHLYDGDPRGSFETLAPAALTAKAIGRVIISVGCNGVSQEKLIEKVLELFRVFNESMIREHSTQEASSDYWEDAYNHVTGRSALFVVYFQILNLLKSRDDVQEELKLLRMFIYYMQIGDDLGDWRSDFLNGRSSPVLSFAARKAGRSFVGEADLEEFVYLSGFYEEVGQFVANGLQRVHDQAASIFSADASGLCAYIGRQITRIRSVVANFCSTKSGKEIVALPLDN